MNWKQFSEAQRCIGRLESFAAIIPFEKVGVYYSTVCRLSKIIDENAPDVNETHDAENEGEGDK